MVTHVHRTTCSRDCPDACGILATVEDGKVTALRGDPDHPVTRGFLCFRTSRFLEHQYGAHRVSQPLLRRGGRFEPVGWDEALAMVAEKLLQVRRESGASAIAHYRSGGSLGLLKGMADLFFDQFGPCTAKVGDICNGAGEGAQVRDFGVSDSNDLLDLHHSRTIVLWGKNATVSNTHLIPVLREARERGARLWLIDPVRHRTVGHVDRFLAPAPGRDLELAFALVRRLLDRGALDPRAAETCSGLPQFLDLVQQRDVAGWAALAEVGIADVDELAEAFAEGPAAILVGWGMQRRRRGGAIVRALDALSAVSGNLFRSGGGCSFYFKRRKAFAPFAPPVTPPRVLREPLFGADLLAAQDPPVRLLWITAGNPVAMLPDSATVRRAIDAVEFVVVVDPLQTETTALADLVLPVPTLLEDDDLLGAFGHHWLGESRPVVPPPPGVRHEVTIFQELARRVGLTTYPQDSIDQLKQRLLAPVADRGASLPELRERGFVRNPSSPQVLFGDRRVATASGKVELMTDLPTEERLPEPPAAPGASAPLWLFSNSTEKSQAAVWSGAGLGAHTWVLVHPDTLPGVAAGALVVIRSAQGELRAELRHDPDLRRDVAVMPKGGAFARGQSANALIPAVATDLGLGAAYLDCLVRLLPA